jgi:sulfur-carrier protein
MATLRLFAQAREAAGTGRDDVPARSVAELLDLARERYGADFADVVPTCNVWVNGEPAEADQMLRSTDEVALLPPVSGG